MKGRSVWRATDKLRGRLPPDACQRAGYQPAPASEIPDWRKSFDHPQALNACIFGVNGVLLAFSRWLMRLAELAARCFRFRTAACGRAPSGDRAGPVERSYSPGSALFADPPAPAPFAWVDQSQSAAHSRRSYRLLLLNSARSSSVGTRRRDMVRDSAGGCSNRAVGLCRHRLAEDGPLNSQRENHKDHDSDDPGVFNCTYARQRLAQRGMGDHTARQERYQASGNHP
jgi:hypothetical protein